MLKKSIYKAIEDGIGENNQKINLTLKSTKSRRTKSVNTRKTSGTLKKIKNEKKSYIIKKITSLAIPSIFSSLIVFSLETINLIFAGKIQTSSPIKQADILNAIGLGNIFQNFGGLLFGIGLTTSIETLCSQDFGKGNTHQLSKWTKICRYFMFIYFLLFSLLCLFSKQIFYLLNQPEDIADLASLYIMSQIPSYLFQFYIAIYTKTLAAQQIFNPVLYINIVGLCLHPLWCYIFYSLSELHVVGLSLAFNLSNFLILLAIFIYIKYYNYEIDIGWREITWADCKKLVSTAFSCGLLHSIDSLGFEIMSVISTYLDQDELDAHICVLNINNNINAISIGFGTAMTTLVGNFMGQNKPKLAIKYAGMGSMMYFTFSVMVSSCLIFFHKYIAIIYISDINILRISSKLMRLVGIFIIADSSQFQFSAIARGIGRQTVAMIWGIIIFIIFQPGLCILLFYLWKKSVYVLWITQIICGFIGCSTFGIILKISDWNLLAKEINQEEGLSEDKNNHQDVIPKDSKLSDDILVKSDNNICNGLNINTIALT